MPRGNHLEKNQVIILIPSHNEIKTLKKICLKIRKLHLKFLVIDDGLKMKILIILIIKKILVMKTQ